MVAEPSGEVTEPSGALGAPSGAVGAPSRRVIPRALVVHEHARERAGRENVVTDQSGGIVLRVLMVQEDAREVARTWEVVAEVLVPQHPACSRMGARPVVLVPSRVTVS